MRNFLFVILFSSFLLTSTELHEMFKISAFIEHYLEHKQSDDNLDFLDFIQLHYSNEHHADKHHKNKLPFKHHHDFSFTAKVLKTNFSKLFSTDFFSFKYIKNVFVINNENRNSSLFNSTIWQPPKF
ncbi:MAG: hypothetical protein KatS3mg035_0386 [Bacteroidia bacterium]|nr:MAG: hypothetical protein KatS3mg035_0386 [Bacteroidia bacterium]